MEMETTDFTNLDHLTFGAGLCSSEFRNVFAQVQMSAPAVVIGNVPRKRTTERALSEHDHVIETLAANTANEPFDIGSLPGRARCGKHLFNDHRLYLIDKVLPENPIPIAQKILGRAVPRKDFPQKQGGPLRGRMGSHRKVHDSSALMRQHEKDIKDLESDRRN